MNSRQNIQTYAAAILCFMVGASISVHTVREHRDLERRYNEAISAASEARAEYETPLEGGISVNEIARLEKEAECLATNVYFEARSESIAGQLAVAFVTINRTGDPRFKDTICGVVHQSETDKSGKPIKNRCQFSWYCDDKPDLIKEPEAYQAILAWSRTFVFSEMNLFDFTGGATHFHTIDVKPTWRAEKTFLTRIDRHMFYKD